MYAEEASWTTSTTKDATINIGNSNVKVASGSSVKSYAYLRDNIGVTISEKPFDYCIYRNEEWRFDGVYEPHPNMYLTISLGYNNAQGFDNIKTDALSSEDLGNAQHYLNRFCPLFYQGKNFTTSVAFSFSF